MYLPRDAEHTVLQQVIAENLEVFLCAAAEAGDGDRLPQFVEGMATWWWSAHPARNE